MARVKVPQKDGEILVSYDGDEPVKYPVTDGSVTVKDEHLDRFVNLVEGSKTEGRSPTGKE